MNIRYEIKGNKQIKNLYIRLYEGKFDISAPINLFILEDDWNWQTESSNSDDLLNIKLQELKLTVLKAINQSFSNGSIITSETLKNIVKEQFNRPTNEIGLVNQDKDIYLVEFANYWLKEKSATWKVGAKKFMSKVQISQYKKVAEQLSEFEKFAESKLALKDISVDDFYEIANWYEENEYNNSTIKRNIGRLQFFLNRANEQGIKVSNAHKQRIYIESDSDELETVYLNEQEIQKIFDLNLEHDYELDNVRDNLILSCWSGLRISDFMGNLKTDNIKDGYISIKTQKTGSYVKLPVHPMVKKILDKRFGQLPKKISNSEYNKQVKVVCQLAELDNLVYGKLWNPEKKRKQVGYNKKWKYVSSHIGRKSLISNLKGKVSNELLQSVGGWSNSAMVEHYNKTSKTEYAEQLNQYWNGK